jgi:hypothetical protein
MIVTMRGSKAAGAYYAITQSVRPEISAVLLIKIQRHSCAAAIGMNLVTNNDQPLHEKSADGRMVNFYLRC